MSAFPTGFPFFPAPAMPTPDVQGFFDRLAAMPKVADIASRVQKGAGLRAGNKNTERRGQAGSRTHIGCVHVKILKKISDDCSGRGLGAG